MATSSSNDMGMATYLLLRSDGAGHLHLTRDVESHWNKKDGMPTPLPILSLYMKRDTYIYIYVGREKEMKEMERSPPLRRDGAGHLHLTRDGGGHQIKKDGMPNPLSNLSLYLSLSLSLHICIEI